MAKRARRDYKEMIVIEDNYIVPPEELKNRPTRFREVYAYPPHEDPPAETASFTFASDAEREEVVQRLRAAGAEGRLTPEELEDRVAQVLRTRTREELPALLEGLPPESLAKRPETDPLRSATMSYGQALSEVALVILIVLVCVAFVVTLGYGVIHMVLSGSNPFGL